MSSTATPQVNLPPMCNTHRALLVQQVGYGPKDPWQQLEVMAGLALFQAAVMDSKVAAELGGDITKLPTLGCLACRKPDAFGEVVQAAQAGGADGIKALCERWKAGADDQVAG